MWWAQRPADNRGRRLLGTALQALRLEGGRAGGVWTGAPQLPSHGSLFPSPPPPPLRLRAHLRCHLSLSFLCLPLSLPLYRSRFVAAAAAAHGWVALSGSASTHFIFFWVFSSPSPSVCAPVALDISLKPARPDRRFSSSFLLARLLPQTPFYRAPPLLLSLSPIPLCRCWCWCSSPSSSTLFQVCNFVL